MNIYAPLNITGSARQYLDEQILNFRFPWYYYTHQINHRPRDCYRGQPLANVPFWSHTLMLPSEQEGREGIINSPYYQFFYDHFIAWLAEQGIEPARVYRAAVNQVHHAVPGALYVMPHTDHRWPHCNWLWYLDDVPGAETVSFDLEGRIVNEWPCRKDWALTFGGDEHTHRLPPDSQTRRVVVFTYSLN